MSILNGFLKFYGNKTIDQMKIRWPSETRTQVNWLSEEEAVMMLEAARGVERMVIHLELRLGLRRVEVLRMRTEDVHFLGLNKGYFEVIGKGVGGGKPRQVSFAPDTLFESQQYLELREEMIGRGRKFNPDLKDPTSFIIYQKGKRVQGYGETAIDNMVQRVADRAGIKRKIGNHTLRRTGARMYHFAGVPLERISAILGHQDTKETMRYIGISMEKQAEDQELIHNYLERKKEEMTGIKIQQTPSILASR